MSVSSSGALETGDGIVRAFSSHANRRSHDPVIMSPGKVASFAEIDALSRDVEAGLATSELEPGSLVGLVAPNGPAFLAGFLALRRAGHTVLLMDPVARHHERQGVLATLGADGVLETSDAWSSAAGFRFVGTGTASARTRGHAAAVVKLTSGSTGSPRAVAMHTDALLADEEALASTMGLHGSDRLWSAVPFSHSYGFTTLALSAIVRGLTLVVPGDLEPFSALGAARKLGVTVFPTVPAYIQALLRLPTASSWPESIRLVIAAGALLPSETAVHFRRVHKQAVHTFYGSSECGGICYDRDGGAAERGTVGTPVRGVRLSLAPLDRSADAGLVVVESPSVGDTYLPDADRRLGLGRFETNDVGTWRGGELALLRRVDRVINVRGRKVDPCEVEAVLSMIEGVTEVVVVGVSSPDGSDEIVRAVMACRSVRPEYRHIAAWCRGRLADHKVPRSVVFVDSIPRTLRGKIDRSALLELDGSLLPEGQSID